MTRYVLTQLKHVESLLTRGFNSAAQVAVIDLIQAAEREHAAEDAAMDEEPVNMEAV